jgi:hypothetical protein
VTARDRDELSRSSAASIAAGDDAGESISELCGGVGKIIDDGVSCWNGFSLL